MYEEKFNSFDKNIVGKAAISLRVPAIVYFDYPGDNSGATFAWDLVDCRVGFLTGYWTTLNGINYAQVELENDIIYSDGMIRHFAYIIMSNYRITDLGKNSGANQIINGLINNNKVILENNLLCAGLIDKMDVANIDIPDEYRNRLYSLQKNMEKRNEKILNSSFFDTKKAASPNGFSQYGSTLTSFMNDPGIGITPVVIYIIVSVVITLLSTALIYLMFKPDYTDSKADLKVSKDLTKALATLSPEARAAVLADLNGQVDKAYVQGKLDGSGSGILKTITYVAAGFLGFTIIDKTIANSKK